MGTRKKVLLASLVSMMMVLAFIIGFVPSHDTESSGAAAPSGRISMAKVLGEILGATCDLQVTLTSRVEGVIVKTPVDNAAVQIPVPVQADVTGTGAGGAEVTFVANIDGDPDVFISTTDCTGEWTGDPAATSLGVTGAVTSPWISGVNVGSFLTGIEDTQQTLAVYALVNAVESQKAITLAYQAANDSALNAVKLDLLEVAGTVDGDDNALPDNLFADVLPGEMWISDVTINGAVRTVLVANLDSGAAKIDGTITASPTSDILVEAPDTAALVNAGLVADGEEAILIVNTVDNLATLLDSVDGDGSQAALDAWAADAMAKAPGALTGMGKFVAISLVYTLNGGTQYDEIKDLSGTGLQVALTMSGLEPAATDKPQLWSFPTGIGDNAGVHVFVNVPGDNAWSFINGDAPAGATTVSAAFDQLSVFAPFNSGLALTGAAPNRLPENFTQDLTLTGTFPVQGILNIAQAAAAYRVYVGGEVAAFRDGTLKAETAVTASEMFVTAPALSGTGPADVQVVDLANPANEATALALVDIVATAVVTSSVVGGTGSIALTESPSDGVTLPANTYLVGTTVSAALTFDAGDFIFNGWTVNGVPAGTANPLSVSVDGATTLVANLTAAGYALNLSASAGGSVVASPAPNVGDKYAPGTDVTLTATADPGFQFAGWGGADGADVAGGAIGILDMNSDKTVVANFTAITDCYTLSLTALPVGGGTIAASPGPDCGAGYSSGSVVTLTATPSESWKFREWAGANAGDLTNVSVDELTGVATADITMNANKSITARFLQLLSNTGLELLPGETDKPEAWIFGGVVRTLTGTGFENGMMVTIGGVAVTGFRASSDGTKIDVVIPAYAGTSLAATVEVDIVAGEGADAATVPGGLRYKRHQQKDGVNTTAFILSNPNTENTVPVTLDGSAGDTTPLVLPNLQVPAGVTSVFGIARNSQAQVAEVKQNTEVIGALGTGLITALTETGEIPAGNAIDNAYDFSLHLYAQTEVAKNTPPAGSAAYSNASGLVDFERPVDANGNPIPGASAAKITLPLDGTNLTYGDVRKGLTIWGVGTAFDYVTERTTITNPETVAYQSELLVTEVDPAITNGTTPPDAASPDLMVQARLYSLNGFSLRTGALLPAEVVEGIRLSNASGTIATSTDKPVAVKIISPLGGIAWVDRVEFRTVAKKTVASVKTFTTTPGSTELELAFNTPKVAKGDAGIMDLVVFLKSDTTVPAVTLERAVELKRPTTNLTSLVLILLGVLIAAIGLLAGGNSGGGGGGPCFIATAAYGTPLAADIDVLRSVRDEFLLTNTVGSAFVDGYYHVSPAIADVVAKSPVLAAIVRMILVPTIFLGKVALAMPVLTALVGMSLGAAYILIRRKARGRA